MATVEQVRALAAVLPRTEEHLIRDQVKFRVGRLVYLALSPDETLLGFACPKEERPMLLAAAPETFLPPLPSDERYNWLRLRLAVVEEAELREIVEAAWRMVVPKRVAAEHAAERAAADLVPGPSLAQLRSAAAVFAGYGVDSGWQRWAAATGSGSDLAAAEHRAALHRWLNSWGCRIRYPRPGEPDLFDAALAAWWTEHGASLPEQGVAISNLTDHQISALATAYAELAALRVSPARTLGPTAAAKALYALRPAAVMPWDAAIATRLHGARDGAAFHRHLRCGRAWARAVLAESGLAEAELPAALGRPTVPLAKVLDDYLYVTITAAAAG
ncbi:MmcQ/YjbR family DNA-binding protein [Kitasatospora sp. NBC_01287]|uniref:MmcQ/YjbR family DNA-binding protein n=1 Tax=Kitasatospora sp. NBC_01287 TaxID=2903573 RepID=UPI002253E4A1|nr:MmcQ/YjbR family DNA-binding protein [Kitasatospora sp. NBC_01287]MCX4748172.1 MmcQ/YjbR family DNA-binding protein [Kitasatospora sp. NBC_01287]